MLIVVIQNAVPGEGAALVGLHAIDARAEVRLGSAHALLQSGAKRGETILLRNVGSERGLAKDGGGVDGVSELQVEIVLGELFVLLLGGDYRVAVEEISR